jgi:D-glycero-D-manno-heptose 1,7-bisphosphate phosphatase
MPKAVFLDRDGVLNEERGTYTFRPKNFTFVEGIIPQLSRWQAEGYLLIVITNQSGIAKGIYTHKQVVDLHNYMVKKLSSHNIELNDIYYCPHHPSVSACLCRKPRPLLLEKAIARYQLVPNASYLIGDKERDIKAGEQVNLRTIKVEPNTNLSRTSLPI